MKKADYWKSQPRKFCEFCKCWLTDNKPSLDFHEKGKRHQENVKNKIDTIKKKSLADAQKKREMESDMEQLNRAALEAFKKDLINDPSLAAQYGISLEGKKPNSENKVCKEDNKDNKIRVKEEESSKDIKPKIKEEKSSTESTCESSNSNIITPKIETDWYEAVSDEGYHYYWNIKTNESVWVAPENYVSLEEQAAANNDETSTNDQMEDNKESIVKVKLEPEEIKKEDNSPKEEEEVFEGPLPRNASSDNRTKVETCTSRKAYGQWTTYEEEAPVDYELPEIETKDIPLPEFLGEEPVKVKFKEKRVTTLSRNGDDTAVAFKKRKVTKGARNMRSRDELD